MSLIRRKLPRASMQKEVSRNKRPTAGSKLIRTDSRIHQTLLDSLWMTSKPLVRTRHQRIRIIVEEHREDVPLCEEHKRHGGLTPLHEPEPRFRGHASDT
mmetsp:Transcript_9315/g.21534  ORF Transcript_9315/g.21534 Transcript_9315/m.21534 type:complete len:100 (+) Transcript_9315:957-1256(+)